MASIPKASWMGFLGNSFAMKTLSGHQAKACFIGLCFDTISTALTGCAGQATNMAGFVAQGSYTSLALNTQNLQFTELPDAGGNYRIDAPDIVSISTFFGDAFRYGLDIGINATPAGVVGYRTKSLSGIGWIGGLGALETVNSYGSWLAGFLSSLETMNLFVSIGQNQVSEIKNSTLDEQVGIKSYPELGVGGVAEFPRCSLGLRLGEDLLDRVLSAYLTLSIHLGWTLL